MPKKLWGGRFSAQSDSVFDSFSSSLPYDCKLFKYDVVATAAHVSMLRKINILTAQEDKKIQSALKKMLNNESKYASVFRSGQYEDVHSLIESEAVRLAGVAAKKIHTGRSRNDQVNQAVRMYCKDNLVAVMMQIRLTQKSLIKLAKKYHSIPISGMTHLQKAQPILASHLFLSYCEMLGRSFDGFADVLKRVDILTLGSGALAGSTIPLDREYVRKKLGFKQISANSLDSVGSRDFMAETIFQLALLMTHLSRIAEDLMIGQLEEVALFEFPEVYCTGSSMMPQKRNGDFVELIRGAASIPLGNLTSIMTLMKGLPTSYNRDLQWDKLPLFASFEIVTPILLIAPVFFSKLKLNIAAAEKSTENDQLCATDLAEYLVKKGVSFRVAHEKVGAFVKDCERINSALNKAPDDLIQKHIGQDLKSVRKLLTIYKSISNKQTYGSTNPKQVERQIKKWESMLDGAF